MQQITFRDVLYSNTKSICECLIKKGMNLEEALAVICNLIKCLEKNINLDGLNLAALGIKDQCDLKTNLLTAVIQQLQAADSNILQTVNGFTQTVTQINQG